MNRPPNILVNIFEDGEMKTISGDRREEIIRPHKRALAYIDILGFKNMIKKTPIDHIYKKYKDSIRHAQALKVFQNTDCDMFIFSDSILIIAKDDSDISFYYLIVHTWRIMQVFMAEKMPLRGAITYGDVILDYENNIFLGEGIVRAVDLESKQNWMGIIIDELAEARYTSLFAVDNVFSHIRFIAMEYDVPLKGDMKKRYRVINWRLNLMVEEGIKEIFDIDNPDKEVQTKIENTLEFSKRVRDNGCFLQGEVPKEMRVMWIGKSQPPFASGDEY